MSRVEGTRKDFSVMSLYFRSWFCWGPRVPPSTTCDMSMFTTRRWIYTHKRSSLSSLTLANTFSLVGCQSTSCHSKTSALALKMSTMGPLPRQQRYGPCKYWWAQACSSPWCTNLRPTCKSSYPRMRQGYAPFSPGSMPVRIYARKSSDEQERESTYPSFVCPTSFISGLHTPPRSGSLECFVRSKMNTSPDIALVAIRSGF